MHHLMGAGEIAELLSISRQRVDQIVRSDESFPDPEIELMTGRVWKRDAIEAWARRAGRLS